MIGDNAAMLNNYSPSDTAELRRRRIRLRAWRRGMRELDLIFGGFANARLDELNEEELAQFEALLDAPDGDVFAWFCAGKASAGHDTPLFDDILAFHLRKGGRA